MKAVLIVDIPDDFEEYCDWYVFSDDFNIMYALEGEGLQNYKSLCNVLIKLKPLPDKIDQGYPCDTYDEGYSHGWDECIDEILSGNKGDE